MQLQKNLTITGENIQRVYDWYIEKIFLVNRKYQRKLVWSLNEKVAFIDSIKRSYSVPLFLVAKKSYLGNDRFEIIDGMQRLNAIFAFIEGEFTIQADVDTSGYFDLTTMASTKQLLDDGKLKQNTPVLNRTICTNIVNYQLPLSVASFNDEEKVEEIFRRINSYGRQLSNQDLRQAGALGKFPDLIRVIASEVRRDSSPDLLDLDSMKEISITNVKLNYGVNLKNIFWVKHDVITEQNMRISRDEELIAYILTHILLNHTANPSSKTLDKLYKFDLDDSNNLASKAENEIEKHGFENIQKRFSKAFDELEKICLKSGKNFRNLIFKDQSNGLVRSFQVIFLSLYELIINQQKQIKNYTELISKLDGIGDRHLKGIDSDKWNGDLRSEMIKSICSIIESDFEKNNHSDPTEDNWLSKFENLLMQSRIEQQHYDFKIGLHELSTDANFNQENFSKIIKTLTAMANDGPNKKGFVIIGIADKPQDKNRYETLYNDKAVEFNGFSITGVQSECKKKYRTRDEYFNKAKQLVDNEPIEDHTKNYIKRNMRFLQYYDKDILVFQIEASDSPLLYDNKFFERHAANISEIEPHQYKEIFKRFSIPK